MVRARGDPETNDRFLHRDRDGEFRTVAVCRIALISYTGRWLLLCHFWRYLRARWSAWLARVAMDIYHFWSCHYFGRYHWILRYTFSPFDLSILTLVVAVQDFPDKNTFLTKEETDWVLNRIEADRADSQYDHFTAQKLWGYICDIHNWSFALLSGCSATTGYAFAYFLPIILMDGLGFSSRDAQLMSAPTSVFASIFAFALAILGDRKRTCAPGIVFSAFVTIVGLCMVCLLVHYSCTVLLSSRSPTDRLPHKHRCSICWCLSRWCWHYCQWTGHRQLYAK